MSAAPLQHAVGLAWEEAAESTPEARTWRLHGDLAGAEPRALERLVRLASPSRGGRLVLDLSDVEGIDSASTAALLALWRRGEREGFALSLEGASAEVRAFLELYRVAEAPEAPAAPGALEALGDAGYRARTTTKDALVLAADVTVQALGDLVRPWRLRLGALVEQSIHMGSRAVGIVALITFLVGLTLAFQSAYQLRQFGAAVYVAALTAVSMVREMGPLITAILVAGRSGSAIASEIATMQVNEEVDALRMMGIPFVPYVAVPRLLSLVLTLPLLTLIADLAGILGGWIVGTTWLGIAPETWLNGTLDGLVPKDLVTGLVKSVAFAWGIALIGLYHGLKVRGGAQEVGRATTSSVVSAIFFIIVADALFSVLFYVVIP